MPDLGYALEAIRVALKARAAGAWRVGDDRSLRLIAFAPSPDIHPETAAAFARAGRVVPISRTAFGIARAAAEGTPFEAIADELDPADGSGAWLPRLGATRSIAVPIFGRSGDLAAIVSVALEDSRSPLAEVVALIRAHLDEAGLNRSTREQD